MDSEKKILLIHGQAHKGSTYNISRNLAEKIGGPIAEFFLPRDFGEFCVGCTNCFMKSETLCPHYQKIKSLTQAIIESDVIILESPVYVYHATGAMKAFLDHYGYMWMIHRPNPAMFAKQGICISTAAGAGMKSTNQDMADSLFWWGCGKIYRRGFAVRSTSWKTIPEKRKKKIDDSMTKLAAKVAGKRRIRPGLKTRLLYNLMRLVQKKGGWNPADENYWKSTGLINNSKPWKK